MSPKLIKFQARPVTEDRSMMLEEEVVSRGESFLCLVRFNDILGVADSCWKRAAN